MALWPSIMACSQCSDITVPLNRGYRPLVWLTRVMGRGKPDSIQIASTKDGGRAEINQRWEWTGEDNKDRQGVAGGSAGSQEEGRSKREGGSLKGKVRGDTL